MIIKKPRLDDAELVRLIYLKSRVGAEVLFDSYATVLILVIFRIVWQKKIADDILEKTFLTAWNIIEDYSFENERRTIPASYITDIDLKFNQFQSKATAQIAHHTLT